MRNSVCNFAKTWITWEIIINLELLPLDTFSPSCGEVHHLITNLNTFFLHILTFHMKHITCVLTHSPRQNPFLNTNI